jgi:hypothetical protein
MKLLSVSSRNARILELAKNQHHREGECEIDDNAIVSEDLTHGDNGAYVEAWVWVNFSGTEFDKGQDIQWRVRTFLAEEVAKRAKKPPRHS